MSKIPLFLIGILAAGTALAKTCPDPARVVPGQTGVWSASGWRSASPVTSPQHYHLNFHQAQLISSREDGSYRYVQCIYNDSYSNGLVTLVPVSNQSSFPHLQPRHPHFWTMNSNGEMGQCQASTHNCSFD